MPKLSEREYSIEYNKKNIVYLTKYRKQYYRENKRCIDNRVKKWKQENAEHVKKWFHEYYVTHRKELIEKAMQFAIDNPDKRVQYCRAWGMRNRQFATLQNKKWRIKNPLKVKQQGHLRRKRGGWIPIEILQRVYEENIKKYGTLTCVLCNTPIEFGQDSIEHLTPLSRGGSNTYENLAIAHKKCNSQKWSRTLEEWRELHGKVITY